MIKIGANFLFFLSSRSVLYFKGQAPQLAQRYFRLETFLSLRGQLCTIYWHFIVV